MSDDRDENFHALARKLYTGSFSSEELPLAKKYLDNLSVESCDETFLEQTREMIRAAVLRNEGALKRQQRALDPYSRRLGMSHSLSNDFSMRNIPTNSQRPFTDIEDDGSAEFLAALRNSGEEANALWRSDLQGFWDVSTHPEHITTDHPEHNWNDKAFNRGRNRAALVHVLRGLATAKEQYTEEGWKHNAVQLFQEDQSDHVVDKPALEFTRKYELYRQDHEWLGTMLRTENAGFSETMVDGDFRSLWPGSLIFRPGIYRQQSQNTLQPLVGLLFGIDWYRRDAKYGPERVLQAHSAQNDPFRVPFKQQLKRIRQSNDMMDIIEFGYLDPISVSISPEMLDSVRSILNDVERAKSTNLESEAKFIAKYIGKLMHGITNIDFWHQISTNIVEKIYEHRRGGIMQADMSQILSGSFLSLTELAKPLMSTSSLDEATAIELIAQKLEEEARLFEPKAIVDHPKVWSFASTSEISDPTRNFFSLDRWTRPMPVSKPESEDEGPIVERRKKEDYSQPYKSLTEEGKFSYRQLPEDIGFNVIREDSREHTPELLEGMKEFDPKTQSELLENGPTQGEVLFPEPGRMLRKAKSRLDMESLKRNERHDAKATLQDFSRLRSIAGSAKLPTHLARLNLRELQTTNIFANEIVHWWE